jgi:hypothetical protein
MPRISAFHGVVVAMFYGDHPPPHVHARYGDHRAQITISTGDVLHGFLPRRALTLVRDWTDLHRDELTDNWNGAEREQPLVSIEPLP